MSGDVQPRKRKDKKKKKDDLGTEEPRGTAAALGEGDVFMHSYHDHGTGGHWCAKIIFFSLLAVLVTLIGLIILENRGLTELEANSVESRYSGVLEGWIEDATDDHHDEHTLELKHHDDDEDHPDDQLDENETEEESLEEETDHNDDDVAESNEDEDESDEIDDENDDDDDEEDDSQDDDEEDDRQDDEDGLDEEDEIQNDGDEEVETHNDDDEGQDEDSDEDEDDGKYDEEIEENLKDHEDDEEETYEHYSNEEIGKSNNDIDENDDEDDEVEEEKHDYLSKEVTSNYYHESYEDNGDNDESKETRYEDDNESSEHNTEDEASEEDDQEDDDDDEQEIEKIEKEIIDGDDSEEIADNRAPASKEKRDVSKEAVKEDTSKEDDEPPIEKISRPPAGKPFVEIEEETPVKPVDTLAEEEAYERQQEELRRQKEQAPHSQGGGNSLEAEWPGEPSDPYWRSELDAAEEEFRQGLWGAAAARAGGAGLANSGRARWLRAAALDRAADQGRDNRLLADAVAAYLHLLKMNEVLSDERLLEVARRTVDRIQFGGTYLRAEPVYRLLIRRFPDDVNFRNNLTVTFLMANRADLADEVLRETLRHWPNDRVALAHHGFVLKIHYNKLEEAVRALRKALDGDAGRANEPRFYYHLGDALLMLGRFDEAHEVHKRGAELGHFLSPSQRSLYNVPRLRARPWWRVEETPYLNLARALEASWRDILKEGEAAVALYEQEKEGLKERGEWSQLDIFVRGREVGGRCARAPAVCAALRKAGRGAGESCRRGQVKFSMMTPGTHVRPHVGPTNCRLRMHLALSNTEGTYIRVDKEIRQWQLGKTFIFDDSFEHEVWHNGTDTRLVLIVDVWHPDLTAAEKRQLPAI